MRMKNAQEIHTGNLFVMTTRKYIVANEMNVVIVIDSYF